MITYIFFAFIWASISTASMFDFIHNQFGGHQQQKAQIDHETHILNSNCDRYLCQDTQACVNLPKDCPCPYPSSQLRCILPNQNYVCISKPLIFDNGKYDDPKNNWKVDAKDDSIRDCGWVLRAWKGLV